MPEAFAELTVQAPYNDLAAVARRAFERRGAARSPASSSSPSPATWAACRPSPGFLEGLRALCDRHGALLVFDEVMTGFRVACGGAQARYGVRPDLTCLGKMVGGGLPAAAYGGRRDLMRQIAPEGPVYQAGTLSGNPLAMAAGLATLERLRAPRHLRGARGAGAAPLADGLAAARARRRGRAHRPRPSAACSASSSTPARCGTSRRRRSRTSTRFRRFFAAMLERGVYLAPSAYEAGFVSLAHGRRELDATLEAARRAFRLAARVD